MAFIFSCFSSAPSVGQHLEVRAKSCVGMCLPFPFTLATASHSHHFQVVAFILSIHGLGKRGVGGSGEGGTEESQKESEEVRWEPASHTHAPRTLRARPQARPSARPPTSPASRPLASSPVRAPAHLACPRDTLCETTKGGREHYTEHNAFL